jgi:nucleotide-binding universal stress UspA family protein
VTHIVVAYDGTSSGRFALERAAAVHRPGDVVDVISVAPSHDGRDARNDVAVQRSLDDALALLSARGISASAAAVAGDPAVAICALAARDGADLIVVGRRDRDESEVRVATSVSSRVVDLASCDVLVTKRPAARRREWSRWREPTVTTKGPAASRRPTPVGGSVSPLPHIRSSD